MVIGKDKQRLENLEKQTAELQKSVEELFKVVKNVKETIENDADEGKKNKTPQQLLNEWLTGEECADGE